MDVRFGEEKQGPLKGLRVIDITAQISGPLCSQQLGDLGADVIKVEPLHGEIARWMAPPQKAGLTGYYCQMNRNKRSLAIDLKSPEGIEIIKKLAGEADVLVENFRHGVPDRLGFGYEAMKAINPRLVYLSITGFGSSGPYSHKPCQDMLAQGLSGMTYIQGKRHGGKPQLIQSTIVDKTTAITATGAVMAALYARDGMNGTGKGQKIDLPMMDAFAAVSFPDMIAGDCFQPSELPEPAPLAVLRVYETTDGYVVGMALQDDHFKAFCEALECPELLENPAFNSMGARVNDFDPWLDAMAEVISRFNTTELLTRLDRAGVPFGPVNTIREFYEDPQVKHNGTVFDVTHPEAGTMRYTRYPGHFSETPAAMYRHPPTLGEHNIEILAEAGFSEAQISKLRDRGVVS